ncbi:hypothetical protein P3T39_007014 [Kitasatospora sp. GP82]|nr:hypothetical protein [Kitasatospora sp. GP82]
MASQPPGCWAVGPSTALGAGPAALGATFRAAGPARASPASVAGPHGRPARRPLTGPQPRIRDRHPKRIRRRFPGFRTTLSYRSQDGRETRTANLAATIHPGAIRPPSRRECKFFSALFQAAIRKPLAAQREEIQFRHARKGPAALPADTATVVPGRPENPARRQRSNSRSSDTKPNTEPGRRPGRRPSRAQQRGRQGGQGGRVGRSGRAGHGPGGATRAPAAGPPDQAQRDGLTADHDGGQGPGSGARQRAARAGAPGRSRGRRTGAARCNTGCNTPAPGPSWPHNAWSDPQHSPVLHPSATPRCTPALHPPPSRRAPPPAEGRPQQQPPPRHHPATPDSAPGTASAWRSATPGSSQRPTIRQHRDGRAPRGCRGSCRAQTTHRGNRVSAHVTPHDSTPPRQANATGDATAPTHHQDDHQNSLQSGLTATQPSSRTGGAAAPDGGSPASRDSGAAPHGSQDGGQHTTRTGRSTRTAGQDRGAPERRHRPGQRAGRTRPGHPGRRPPDGDHREAPSPTPRQTEHRPRHHTRPPKFRPEFTPPPATNPPKQPGGIPGRIHTPKTAHNTRPTPEQASAAPDGSPHHTQSPHPTDHPPSPPPPTGPTKGPDNTRSEAIPRPPTPTGHTLGARMDLLIQARSHRSST